MARKGLFTEFSPAPRPNEAAHAPEGSARAPLMPRGAVGALQSSLARMQANAVQDVAPELIDHAGVEDRLAHDDAAHRALVESLRTYGQQVPVLLRPHPETAGRFEIVYGRRRLRALRELGQPVRAMVRQLDDHALVMAQGQENTARQDLSFIEKASFAAQLAEAGYERQTICDALSIDLPMVSRMLKVGQAFPLPFLRRLGSAPGIGRERWLALASAVALPTAWERALAAVEDTGFADLSSDARFEVLFKRVTQPVTLPKAPALPLSAKRVLHDASGKTLAELRRGPRGVTITIPTHNAGFDRWLEANAEEVVSELHDRWMNRRQEDQT